MSRYGRMSDSKQKIIALTVVLVLLAVVLMGVITSWFTDFNPFCWFGHEYNEVGVCTKCDYAIEAEPDEEGAPTTPEVDDDASSNESINGAGGGAFAYEDFLGSLDGAPALAYVPVVASTSTELNSSWIECESWEESCPVCGSSVGQDGIYQVPVYLKSGDEFWENIDYSAEIVYTLTTEDVFTYEAGFVIIERDSSFYYSDSDSICINVPGVYRFSTMFCNEGVEEGCGYCEPVTIEVVAASSDNTDSDITDTTAVLNSSWKKVDDLEAFLGGELVGEDYGAYKYFTKNGVHPEITPLKFTTMDKLAFDVDAIENSCDYNLYIVIRNAEGERYVASFIEGSGDPVTINIPGEYTLFTVEQETGGDMAYTVSEPVKVTVEVESYNVFLHFVVDGSVKGYYTAKSDITVTADFKPSEFFAAYIPEGYRVKAWKTADGVEFDYITYTENTTFYAELEKITHTITLIVDDDVYKKIDVDYGTTVSEALKKAGLSLSFTPYEASVLDTEVSEDMEIVGEVTAAGQVWSHVWVQYLVVAAATLLVVALVLYLRKRFGR